jgi:ABC-type sugar transport system substrate-binding protein
MQTEKGGLMHISTDRRRHRRGPVIGLAALIFAAILLAGCGGSSSSSSGSGSAEEGGKQVGGNNEAKAKEATEAGDKAGEKSGEVTSVEKQVVGLIQSVGAAESIQRETSALETAAGELGWSVKVCDGEGDPVKQTNCANTLMSQHVTAMLVANVEVAPVKAQMETAKQRGIPWINIGGLSRPSPLYTQQVVENEPEIGTKMGEYIAERLEGKGTVAATEYPAIDALALRMNALYKVLEKSPEIEIVNKHVVNFENLVGDVRSWSESALTKEPNLGAFALCIDTDPVAVASVVQSKDPGKQYPERPLIVGSLGDLANLELIRKGQIDATTETALGATAWIAVDQLAGHFAHESEFAKDPQTAYGLPFLEAQVITKENVPKNPKEYAEPPADFEAFFRSKWETEFKNG